MVVARAIEIRTDAHALHPQFAVDDGAISIHQTGLAKTDALDLRTRQHDASCEGLDEEVFKRRLLVLYLYRTFFPDLFFCLIHYIYSCNSIKFLRPCGSKRLLASPSELSLNNCREAFEMIVNIVSDVIRPFLLMLHKLIVEVVEVRELLEECHKLFLRHFLLNLLTMLEP